MRQPHLRAYPRSGAQTDSGRLTELSVAADVVPSDLLASSPRLTNVLAEILEVASSHGQLYDRQNLGATTDHVVLGPPGRAEFNRVDAPRLPVINLAANSYLGLANDLRVARAATAALDRHGMHTGGSRLLCGTASIHYDLEQRLAEFMRAPRVVTYSSGYVANVSVIAALFGPGDVILLDRGAHRSLYDGALLSGAAVNRFAHNDLDHLELMLRRTAHVARRLVAVDGVYSMEGHVVPLPDLLRMVRRHRAFLLVDDAHAIGVLGAHGRGTAEHLGVDPASIDIRIGTLSKAVPAVGGFAAVSPDIAIVLRYSSHGTLFSAALTPPDVGASLAALDIMEAEPERVDRVRKNGHIFRAALAKHGLDTMGSETAIVPIRVGSRAATLDAAAALLERGVFVNPVIHPGIPRGRERLRCFVSAAHAPADLEYAAEVAGAVVPPLQRRTR